MGEEKLLAEFDDDDEIATAWKLLHVKTKADPFLTQEEIIAAFVKYEGNPSQALSMLKPKGSRRNPLFLINHVMKWKGRDALTKNDAKVVPSFESMRMKEA